MKYRIKRFGRGRAIENHSEGYSLILVNSDSDLGVVHFYNWNSLDQRLPKAWRPVTGRSLDTYAQYFPKIPVNPKLQYAEVGAGIGAFIPSLVSSFNGKIWRPIIIDPANYQVMKEMLQYTLRKKLTIQSQTEMAERFLERIKIITDPNRVRLYNKTLGCALQENPELRGCADVVIDLAGPKIYCETEIRKEDRFSSGKELKQILELRVKLLEMQLLKPGRKRVFS